MSEPEDKKKPIPPGLENNDAFLEYRGLKREEREAIRRDALELPDLGLEMEQAKKIESLTDVVKTQLAVIDQMKVRERVLKDTLYSVVGRILGLPGADQLTVPMCCDVLGGIAQDIAKLSDNPEKPDPPH